jgi:hypothetical protein
MAINAAQSTAKTVADPNDAYESMRSLWARSRAVCSGERYVKDFDGHVDTIGFTNLLIPFSPSMTTQQYTFYRAEAELPGITAQFGKMLVGGLLRKKPTLSLPADAPAEASDWILNQFGKDDGPITAFLDQALWEEVQTSRAWVFVDYPDVGESEMSPEEAARYKPYPVLHKAEAVVNWRVRSDEYGKTMLDRVIVRGHVEDYSANEFHPALRGVVWVHELNPEGQYQIREFQERAAAPNTTVIAGQRMTDYGKHTSVFEHVKTVIPKAHDLTLESIPAWPLNGSLDLVEPLLSSIIDKEVALYNKVSRRNHLLYGASTYTPVITSDMLDEEFQNIVDSGLGSWIRLRPGDTATVLETPTAALADMDRAIESGIEEMAKLGIRMLSPESAQSGVALEIRNAAQTAQLGTLNNKISATMSQVIAFMLNWRYDTAYTPSDVSFSLSADFNPIPLGADWLRLATEWYEKGLIPRTIWLSMLKQNDMIPPEYDDQKGQEEINSDQLLVPQGSDAFAENLKRE